VQALTGAILAMYYEPSAAIDPVTAQAGRVLVDPGDHERPHARLARPRHAPWGASVFIILLFLHMGRVFLFGAYKYPRELTWITGVLILATGMLMGFTGYLLPWDQTAYWASAVGINLNGTAPFAGPWLAQFLAGGPEIGTRPCRSSTPCTCC
jgi:quinol-cytochrome oxidoreductase complex cytochrome b subunit